MSYTGPHIQIETKLFGGLPCIAKGWFDRDIETGDCIADMQIFTTEGVRAKWIEKKMADSDWDSVANQLFEFQVYGGY